jgi:hypothetical protein
MQLLLEHSQKEKVFRLWAKYELSGQELTLVDRYNIRGTVLVEGNPREERERAVKMGGALGVVVFLLIFLMFGFMALNAAITMALIVFAVGSLAIYKNIREKITVEDILNGRHFACQSIITLLEKKQQISKIAEDFTQFLEALKNWGGREVIEMAPGRAPVARFVDKPHAAE